MYLMDMWWDRYQYVIMLIECTAVIGSVYTCSNALCHYICICIYVVLLWRFVVIRDRSFYLAMWGGGKVGGTNKMLVVSVDGVGARKMCAVSDGGGGGNVYSLWVTTRYLFVSLSMLLQIISTLHICHGELCHIIHYTLCPSLTVII